MKRILRIGEGYAFSKHKLKYSYIRYFSLVAVATIMCLYAHAQRPEPSGPVPLGISLDGIKPLQIGDTIPEYLWQLPLHVINHPEGKDTITLGDYRNKKLLILEFWGFSCSGCIQSINRLDTIKNTYDDDRFAFLPIHMLPYPFDEAKMLDYVGKAAERNRWSVASVVKDTALYQLFSRYLPDWGDVWILDGRLLAVPAHGYISEPTITAVLEGGFVDFRNRLNLPPLDPYRPIFEDSDEAGDMWRISEQGAVGGYIPHREPVPLQIEYRGDSTFLYAWNQALPDLLYEAYKPDIMQHLTTRSGIDWEIGTGMEARLGYKADTTLAPFDRVVAREAWNAANRYGYQLIVPYRLEEAEALNIMQRDMEAFASTQLGLRLSIDTAEWHTYAVLYTLGSTQATKQRLEAAGDGVYTDHDGQMLRFTGYPKETFVHNINSGLRRSRDLELSILQVIDSTGIPDSLTCKFQIPRSFRDGTADFATIQHALRQYGLQLKIRHAKVPVLVVRDARHDSGVAANPINH